MSKLLDDEAAAALEEDERLRNEARELVTKSPFTKADQDRLSAIDAALAKLHATEAWQRARPQKQ